MMMMGCGGAQGIHPSMVEFETLDSFPDGCCFGRTRDQCRGEEGEQGIKLMSPLSECRVLAVLLLSFPIRIMDWPMLQQAVGLFIDYEVLTITFNG